MFVILQKFLGRSLRLMAGSVALAACAFWPGLALASEGGGVDLGTVLPLWSVVPFVGILLSIAVMPLAAGEIWHHHFGKIAAAWSVLFAGPFVLAHGGHAVHELVHIMALDYVPFLILLGGLFTVAGGIVLKGTIPGTPKVNTLFLAVGTLFASAVGTTGISMLLIRPMLRANASRKNKAQVVIFFIFLVSNIGGSLSPLGDPPLFLGFLRGVPFFWTMKIAIDTFIAAVILLTAFFFIDSYFYKREQPNPDDADAVKEPVRIEGSINFLFLAGIVGAVLMSGMWQGPEVGVAGIHTGLQNIARDLIIVTMAVLSWKITPKQLRADNGFTWAPIEEVAILFAGIFVTIIPALAILKAGSHGALAFVVESAQRPWHFFWLAGGLSSFLDNAPTYLTFFNTAMGNLGLEPEQVRAAFYDTQLAASLGDKWVSFEKFLAAVSAGAVFMGANTYIGNAPNFMVKSIAEENDVRMPSFFGYMLWALIFLIPTFVLITFISFV